MARSGFAREHLRSFIERIERLEEEKKATSDDIKEVYAEAKGTGFDTKVMRMVIRLRKMESADREEQQAMLDLYMAALGMGGAPPDDVVQRAEAMVTAFEAEREARAV